MTSHSDRNILIRLWLGFWNGVTTLRVIVFNIVFLFVLAVFIAMVFGGADKLQLDPATTLVIDPDGVVVEQYVGTPLERMLNESLGQELPQTQLRDLVAVLEQAAGDERIAQVLIQTDRLLGVGPGALSELSAAFGRFRDSGKSVIASGAWMTQSAYLLASMADEVWLEHEGLVLLEGYSSYRQYYAEALEKLSVDVNLIRVGEYKSAAEPYIRSSMSEEDREARLYVLGDLWQDYLAELARNRGLPLEVLVDLIERLPFHLEQVEGSLSALALEHGLVDRVLSRPEIRAELARRGAADERGGFVSIGFRDYLDRPTGPSLAAAGRVGIIVAQGSIVEGDQPPGTIGGDSTSRLFRQALNDDEIDAVVLRIDSGGGSAFASEQIRREMMALRRAGKPVVVSMSNVAASGGYWIAMGADEVWAYPSTITGSIGIFGLLPTFEESLARIGVYTDGVGTAPLAGAFRPDRSMSDELRRLLQSVINNGYRSFIELVAEHRHLSVEQVDRIARGRIWSGSQARDRGLVDQLGTLAQATASAARMAGLGEGFEAVYVEPALEPWQAFLVDIGVRALSTAGVNHLPAGLSLPAPLALGQTLLRDLTQLVVSAGTSRSMVMAHCLCEAPR